MARKRTRAKKRTFRQRRKDLSVRLQGVLNEKNRRWYRPESLDEVSQHLMLASKKLLEADKFSQKVEANVCYEEVLQELVERSEKVTFLTHTALKRIKYRSVHGSHMALFSAKKHLEAMERLLRDPPDMKDELFAKVYWPACADITQAALITTNGLWDESLSFEIAQTISMLVKLMVDSHNKCTGSP